MRKRLIASIFLKNGSIVRSEDFLVHQTIGNPISQAKRYSDWAVDEIMYIDISRSSEFTLRRHDHKDRFVNSKYSLLSEIAKNIFVPLAYGGGVRTIEDIRLILQAGADKVILNTGMYKDRSLLANAAKIFGSQALVACVDYRGNDVYFDFGNYKSKYAISSWCTFLEGEGIGEIVLQDISRDGKATGYDMETIAEIVRQVDVPVIALGGAGDYYDFNECFEIPNLSAAAAGNIFHFKEHSYYHAKRSLERGQVNIRKEYGVF
ncbi:MAG: imidazole glycerol phosphate synthase subunit HisF [Gammaproteobacteria bacterium]|nr:imidazole glycerol phosphate synthase subunit HisF [Gammaproteobacteria bacterium]